MFNYGLQLSLYFSRGWETDCRQRKHLSINLDDYKMRGRRSLFTVFSLHLVLLGFMAGCGPHKAQVVPIKPNELTPISFLKDGQTTKSEVISRLEERQARKLEAGRILIFALDKKYQVVSFANKARFHLTLVFDEIDVQILKRHSLVRVR
jgi:hypothetical protein